MELPPEVREIEINNRMRPYGRAHIGGPTDGKMEINLRRGDVVDTIIHETLHLVDPMMDHDKVYSEAAKIEGKMSLPEMADLLMQAHMRSQYPVHRRQITHSTASKVISSNIK